MLWNFFELFNIERHYGEFQKITSKFKHLGVMEKNRGALLRLLSYTKSESEQ